MKQQILGGSPFYPPYLSASVVQLLSRTLCKDPDLRITLSQIQVRWPPRLCVREYKCTRTHARTHTHTHTQNHAWYLGMSVSQQKVAGTFVDDRQVPNYFSSFKNPKP